MPGRFDITRVRLRNFRNFAACDVRLGPLMMLVGPNGSGKSNFLDSLRFTAQGLSETLDNALRDRGGISEVRRRSRGHPTKFEVGLWFRTNGRSGRYRYQVGAGRGGGYRVTHEECIISSAERGRGDRYYRVRDGRLEESSEPTMPAVSDDRLYLVAASGLKPFRPVFDGLAAVNVYNLNPDAMRQLQKPEAGELLRRDGSNVASVLERLRRERPDTKKRIEEYLSRIVEGVVAVDRRGLGAWETIEFRQTVAGDESPWTFPASSMSDGTLRALGVLVSLFAGSTALASPVGIEEPEVALHPAAAGLLLDALRDASESRQVLLTTHSPDLLDSPEIRPEELLAVRSHRGNTQINYVDEGGLRAMRDALLTPGELLRVDQLVPAGGSPEQLELFPS